MPKSRYVVVLFLLLSFAAHGQSLLSRELEGKVYSDDGDVAATHVLNTTTERAAITDLNGYFKITMSLNDTIVFSAVQYKRKEIVITQSIFDSKFINVPLENALTELEEVVVMPYNLTGDMSRDADRLGKERIITASTLGLPNAYAKSLTKAERVLSEATSGGGLVPLNPILNGISGRTKYLKKQVELEKTYARTERVKRFYADSLIVADLKIPLEKIDDFLYFCEIDSAFQTTVDTHDKLKIWEFMVHKGKLYRENNKLD
ncbi:hypothetical protein FGM00_03035 [Aggregatimonas sangjinii]|uniref:Carboxypeptidase-like regulatory domain-containing protein n=1 Tax=Aggregatimonas sangjinii TaxID=2583587 RepID=A0A5B7SQ60_9FLAO|nr:carboxypeptidase-like regulatory domain-containing protein [Aggregatimonas sangjinii]QCW99137.1 hypothetical protein FGM00_03035 [Aggregatimonas sangjinii]